MRECGWFRYCSGIIIGRPDGYSDKNDFTFSDALDHGLGSLDVPVIYMRILAMYRRRYR